MDIETRKWGRKGIFYLYVVSGLATYSIWSWRHITEFSLSLHTTSRMALKLVNLGFHSSIPCSPRPLKDRFVVRCSKVEQISFTESENSLIEALLGIQGRGRSSSPQQLNVSISLRHVSSIPFWIQHSFCFLFVFQAVERAVQVLERLGGVPDPVRLQFHRILIVLLPSFFSNMVFKPSFLPLKLLVDNVFH